ncbi:hypothetical protein BGW41_006405 [Actinomortierella wolfii]|nr:hypothetical protein BGW41_006405 [Actinomortierella wolfii]
MVERRETGKTYALKYISKAQVIKMDAVKNVLRERQILETLDHIFVVNMRFAFQDDEYMYMCMDLMMGGDLRFHLNRKSFGEDVVRFWICELASAVTHLHSLGIVHRDIKPDNVLLDEHGHVHLTDFNIGCKLTPEKPVLTSQSGTVAYMAPEVFKGSGYGVAVDWWAVGILFYEALYQKRPFQTENIADLKKAIQYQTIEYPEKEGISRECVAAIRGFLNRDPNERLGIRNGMNGIKYHPFFIAGAYRDNIENWWQLLESKQLRPKFQPSSEHVNFDATYDLEELLLDDEPLTYRSTRKRALRMQKEKDRLQKEENARIKAEQEAAAAAAAEAAFAAMSLGMDGNPDMDGDSGKGNKKKLAKKRSKMYLGGGGDKQHSNSESTPSSANGSRAYLGAPGGQPQHSNNPSSGSGNHPPQLHSIAQLAQQTQFQSIPLSPIATSPGSSGTSNIQYPTPPQPSASRHSSPHYRHSPNQPSPPSSYQSRTHAPSPPGRPSSPPVGGGGLGSRSGYTYSTSTGFGGTIAPQQPGVTAIYLSKPAYGKVPPQPPKDFPPYPSKRPLPPHPDGPTPPAPRISQPPPSRPPPPLPPQQQQQQQQQNLSSVRSGDWRQEDDEDIEGSATAAGTNTADDEGDEDELQGIMTADEIMGRPPQPPPRASSSPSPVIRGIAHTRGTGGTSTSSPLSSSPRSSPTLGPQSTPPHNSLARPLPRPVGGSNGPTGNAQHTRDYHQLQQQVQQAHMQHQQQQQQPQQQQYHHMHHNSYQQQQQQQLQAQPQQPQQQPQYGGPAPYKKASVQPHMVPVTNHGNDDPRIPNRMQSSPMHPQHQQLLQQQLQQVYQVPLAQQQQQQQPLAAPQPPQRQRSPSLKGKDKVAYMMALIEREFTTFDYTMYEKYGGVVDPVTMSVGDPPEWVRRK